MKALRQQNAAQLLSETADRFPDRPAICCESGTWNYSQFNDAVQQMSGKLVCAGLTAKSRAALWAEATPQSVFAFFALQNLGVTVVMLNTCLRGPELEKQLRCSDAQYLVVESPEQRAVLLAPWQNECKAGAEKDRLWLDETTGVRILTLSELPDEKDPLQALWPGVNPQDIALMLFTSGTTSGMYKVVCSSGVQLANAGRMKAADIGITERDVICCAIPMFHIFCINCNMLAAVASGACLVLPPDRHSKTLLAYIKRYHCTILTAVPSIYMTLIERLGGDFEQVKSLRRGVIGGAYCSPETFCEIEKSLGLTLLSGLGQTEVSAGITMSSPTDSLQVRSTTLGRFVDRLDGRIWNGEKPSDGTAAQVGEIQVRGPMVMLGYYANGDVLPAVDEDGWFHTGDLGWCDTEGNIHYAGRIKDIIIRGGENIMPSEIEQVIAKDPRVASCKAVGIPDAHYGEVPCICIVLHDGAQLGEHEVRSILCQHLAPFKVPKHVLFFPAFPYTNTGKINRKKIAEMAKQAIWEQANILNSTG